MPLRRSASISQRTSPPGRPKTRSTPASASSEASASATVSAVVAIKLPPQGSDEELAAPQDLDVVEEHVRPLDDGVDVDTGPNGPSEGRVVAEGDVDGPDRLLVLEDHAGDPGPLVGPDAELGQVAGARPFAEELEQASAGGPVGLHQLAAPDHEPHRRLQPPDPGHRGVDHQLALGGALQRGQVGLPGGEVAEGPGGHQPAGAGPSLPPLDGEAKLAPRPAADED